MMSQRYATSSSDKANWTKTLTSSAALLVFAALAPQSAFAQDATPSEIPVTEAAIEAPTSFDDPYSVYGEFDAASEKFINYEPLQRFYNSSTQTERGRSKLYYKGVKEQGLPFITSVIQFMVDQPVKVLNKNEQLAYWLNMHNILVIQAIAKETNGKKVTDTRTGADDGRIWMKKRIEVEGVKLSIEDIEKHILLNYWGDNPNVLYGLYQGTKGGPGLTTVVYTGENVRNTLKKSGEKFVNSAAGLKIKGNKAQVSELHELYKTELFEGSDEVLLAHLKTLVNFKKSGKLQDVTELSVLKENYRVDSFKPRQAARSPGALSGGGGTAGGLGS